MFNRSRPVLFASLVAVALVTLAGCGGSQPPITPASPSLTATTTVTTTVPTATTVLLAPMLTVGSPTLAPMALATAPDTAAVSVMPTAPAIAAAKNLAPDIAIGGQEKWFNSAPLTLAGLRGKPVFLVFWSDI